MPSGEPHRGSTARRQQSSIEDRPTILIIGAGFAGLAAARRLARRRADASAARVVLLDRRNHHTFQPLLYQVATAALSPADIAYPVRRIFRDDRNVEVRLGQAERIDLDNRRVTTDAGDTIAYDALVVAAGATHTYFGNDRWAPLAPGLKTVEDALEIRSRILMAFERAEYAPSDSARKSALTFVIVGAGPTGVELAGAICEIAAKAIPEDFRHVDTTSTRVILVEGDARVLHTMPEDLSRRAERDLRELGVDLRLGKRVTDIEPGRITIGTPPPDGDGEVVHADNVFWAAGVAASPINIVPQPKRDHSGRPTVEPDLSLPGYPEVFVVGDLADAHDAKTGEPVPGVAPAAVQQGQHAGKILARRLEHATGTPRADVVTSLRTGPGDPFEYHDKGSLATIGRARAVGVVFGRHLTGFIAWLLWAVVHIGALIGFRNRLRVMFGWTWEWFFFSKGARLITDTDRRRQQATGEPTTPRENNEQRNGGTAGDDAA